MPIVQPMEAIVEEDDTAAPSIVEPHGHQPSPSDGNGSPAAEDDGLTGLVGKGVGSRSRRSDTRDLGLLEAAGKGLLSAAVVRQKHSLVLRGNSSSDLSLSASSAVVTAPATGPNRMTSLSRKLSGRSAKSSMSDAVVTGPWKLLSEQ